MSNIEAIKIIASKILTKAEGDDQVASKLLTDLHNSIVKEYRPLINSLPILAEEVAEDLIPVLESILTLIKTVCEDEELKEITIALSRLSAERKYIDFRSLEIAGFSQEQSMAILLTKLAKERSITESVGSAIKKRTEG